MLHRPPLVKVFLWLELWITGVFRKESSMLLIYTFLIFSWFSPQIYHRLPLTLKLKLEHSPDELVVTAVCGARL